MRSKILMKTCLLSIVILSVCFIGFSKEKIVESIWSGSPLNIDGTTADWGNDTLSFYKKAKVDYAFRNNAENFYVLFIFKNLRYLSSIRHTGLTVWFNTEGKKAKAYGVNFKEKEVTADELIARMEKEQGPLQNAQKQEIKKRPSYFIYTGDVVDKKGNVLTEASLEGKKELPAFRSKPIKGVGFVHEFEIPLSIFEKIAADYALEPGQSVKIGFEWGGFTKEVREALSKQQLARGVVAREGAHDVAVKEEVSDASRRDPRATMAYLRKQARKYSFWVDLNLAEEK